MAFPNLKKMFSQPGLKVGHSIFEFESSGLGQIMNASGVDFVFLDMEHSGFSFADTKRSITGFRAGSIPTLVRPPSNSYDHISRALDIGADGVIMPMVSSKEEAEYIVSCMKYPPKGDRGVALGIAHDWYKSGDTAKVLSDANHRTVFVALIETEEGLSEVEKIASVKDLDCLWIGHFDLSCSLGINGQFTHPDFIKATKKVQKAAQKYNKALGQLVNNAESGVAYFERGFDVICYSGDVWVYQNALAKGISDLRENCKKARQKRKN